MFSGRTLIIFSLAALGLLITPGPAVLYIVACSVSQGRRAGLASVLGIELGSLVHVLAATLGLSVLLMASPMAFRIVKYVGAAYLIYLGVRALLSREQAAHSEESPPQPYAALFGQGFLVNLLNPKTALFFYSFLPQFVDPSRGPPARQIFLLGGLFVLLATCTDSIYALASSGVGGLIKRNARLRSFQRYFTGGIYIALGIVAAA